MPTTAIAAVVMNVKIASDIIKGMISLKTTAEINAKAIELQSIILDLQSSVSLHQQVHFKEITKRQNAEKKIMEMENWEKTASQYERVKLGTRGITVFARKPFMNSCERDTYICPNCYNKKTESFLQPGHYDKYSHKIFCSDTNCKLSLEIIDREMPDDYEQIQRGRGEF